MSEYIGERAEESSFSGWYYDEEMNNSMTRCSLHANQKLETLNIPVLDENGKDAGELVQRTQWVNMTKKEDGLDMDDAVGGQELLYPYSLTPICSSIFTDDFTVSANNSWSPFGGDAIGELWKNVKPLAAYAEHTANVLVKIGQEQEKQTKEERDKVNSTTVSKFLSKLAEGAAKFAGEKGPNGEEGMGYEISDYLNRCLKVQGTRFSYYNGTNVTFGNLGMKFTIFPQWVYGADNDVIPKFESTLEQVERIYPYVIGRYVNMEQDENRLGQWVYEKLRFVAPDIKNYIGWECPPGGFRVDTKNVDVVQRGTLKLKLGPWFSITNLVCSDASFTFSKQLVKNPNAYAYNSGIKTDGENLDSTGILSPLYCDVTLNLTPVTEYSDESLRRFVKAANNRSSVVGLNTKIWDRLQEEKDKLKHYSDKFK